MTGAAILVHGAGSTPDAAARLLAPAVPAGCDAVAIDARAGVHEVVARIGAAVAEVRQRGGEVVVAAGISLGAHAVALWALQERGPLPRLALVMPAWTGDPGDVAALTAASAAVIETEGVGAVLDALGPEAVDDWVVDELTRAWTGDDPRALAAALRAAAASRGPRLDELAALDADVAVVALADDPLHPDAVARAWAAAIPGAVLEVVGRHDARDDRGALGRAASRAWASR